MSIRHTPRQPERDIRLHDPHAPHAHLHALPPLHAHGHPPHINGNGIPTTPLSSASQPPPPASQLVSPPAASSVTNGVIVPSSIQKLSQANEQTWLLIGQVAEQMGNLEHALSAYENALRHNPMSLPGLTQVAGIARIKENYPKAVEYFQRVLSMQQENGEVWSALGHCYLMQDDLQKAYAAYQQALYLLPNPKEDPKLWYGIGILYDRYGSLDHAEEAFASVLKMDKDFDKANEILFRLGIIYKQQGKYSESLECFDRILRNPPNPLAHADIWFQIGHVYEQQRDHVSARDAYERVVADNPGHAKVLQQLGWLYHQDGSSFQNQDLAIQYLTKSLEADAADAQSWYLLGRAYMAGQKYNKAYEAYQQAVYRDGRNPTFWCSIGVLYFQINQYRDALDAYSRAIRINPYISEVWYDLGSLYESCNNQISDAIDAYARASELDPSNTAITQRLQLLKTAQATGGALPAAPGPQDVHPTAYANPMIPAPAGLSGPPLLLQSGTGPRPIFRTDSRGPGNELPLPVPPTQLPGRSSPGPFRGGPPPPVVLDDSQHVPSHTALAPMAVDRPPSHRESSSSYPREALPRGAPGQGLLLHHPIPQQQVPGDGLRNPQGHPHDASFARPIHMSSPSPSPPPHAGRPRSVLNRMPPGQFAEGRPSIGPGQTPIQRSPTMYAREPPANEREAGWDRRLPPADHREWERDRRGRPSGEFPGHPQQQFYSRPHSPSFPPRPRSPRGPRDSPTETSPRSGHPGFSRHYWDPKHGHGGPGPMHGRNSPPPRAPVVELEPPNRRYDPRFDGRESQSREYEREAPPDASYPVSPETMRMRQPPPPPPYPIGNMRTSESPHLSQQQQASPADQNQRRRRVAPPKEKETEAPPPVASIEPPKRKRRPAKRVKEEPSRNETPAYGSSSNQPASFRVEYRQKAGSNGSPEPVSSTGSGSASRSVQPSPTSSVHPPARVLDENYDEGVADALMDLASSSSYRPSDPRAFAPPPNGNGPPSRSPPSNGSNGSRRMSASSPHSMARHPSMMNRPSPPMSTKRPLSPGPDDHPDSKRSRVGSINRRMSPQPADRPNPVASSRPSPVPFRHQPTSHSPEMRQSMVGASIVHQPSPPLPAMLLPPHPRPIGTGGLASHGAGVSLPPMNTRSPPANAISPTMEDDRQTHSTSPPRAMSGKREIVLHPAGSPPGPGSKGTPSPASSHGSHAKIAVS